MQMKFNLNTVLQIIVFSDYWMHGVVFYVLGSVLGLLLDVDEQQVVFYLDGEPLPPNKDLFKNAK